MPWAALKDDNCCCRIHTLYASSMLFTMPSTLVMCLQIMVNPFQSASRHTKRGDDGPMKDPAHNLLSNLPQREILTYTKKGLKVHKIRAARFLYQGHSCLSPKRQSQMTVKEKRCSTLLQTCHTQTHEDHFQ